MAFKESYVFIDCKGLKGRPLQLTPFRKWYCDAFNLLISFDTIESPFSKAIDCSVVAFSLFVDQSF